MTARARHLWPYVGTAAAGYVGGARALRNAWVTFDVHGRTWPCPGRPRPFSARSGAEGRGSAADHVAQLGFHGPTSSVPLEKSFRLKDVRPLPRLFALHPGEASD